ncbi:hypothetical protein [uncultured Alistipes sp.]|uniref:hypothetical protein n=1 Tax=uncultured Alistipes sp. TaxID=538949 RepID=UPI00261DCCF0|nr:hypothetical protein [uncultured Alistipes sp.]
MTRQILLPASVLREMRETFKVGRNVLRRALNYEHNSKRAKALRVAALERGGLIYTGERAPRGYCPNVETRYDHVRGMMYQNIGNRVQLQINRETNAASIIIDHEPVATFNDMTIGTWSDVLYSLQKIHNQLNA